MTGIAYLVLAHHQPRQLALVVHALAQGNSFVFIHVDAAADLNVFKAALVHEAGSQNVFFTDKRVHGIWGHFSLVEATLLLLKAAASHPVPFDHFILLSGQDFPLKSNTFIATFLAEHKGFDFIEHYPLPSDRLCERQGGLYRVNRYHTIAKRVHDEFPPYSRKPVLNGLFDACANFHHRYIRKMPLGMQPYAGSQWWMLSRKTVLDFLSFLDAHQEIEGFFKNVWIPDELFFQTVLHHIKQDDTSLINNNYRFTKWDKNKSLPVVTSPQIVTTEDKEELLNADALFARKFDEIKSRELVEVLSKQLLEQDNPL
ncbi:MAG TPA: beta-1,6-N-acetylglucosaminyltransferase [Flavisolibacter sp.]